MKLSVIIPIFNNNSTISELVRRCYQVSFRIYSEVEIILVDDGSNDETRHNIKKIAEENEFVKAIFFTRNFGQHIAMMAGLEYASGDEFLWIDADLEEDPEYLLMLKNKLDKGYEIVAGIRQNERHSLWRRFTAKLYTYIYSLLCDYPVIDNITNMRLMTQSFRSYLMEFQEAPFIGGMTTWTGIKIGTVPFQWKKTASKSRYSLKKLISHARIGLISFSSKILRIVALFGILISSLSFFYLVFLLVNFFFYEKSLPGFLTLACFMSFSCGLNAIFLGIFGEYLVEIFELSKKRPKYLIYKKINF